MMIKQKIKNVTKYNNINNTRNYTNTEPQLSEKIEAMLKRIKI